MLIPDRNQKTQATGGWFDRRSLSHRRVTVSGSTWRGGIIWIDILPACCPCVGSGNSLVTSPVRSVAVSRAATFNCRTRCSAAGEADRARRCSSDTV